MLADATVMRNLARLERMAMSPGTARKLFRLWTQTDVRHVLPAIRVPTLILHRIGDQPVRVGHARYLAERIAGAKYIELPGSDHMPFFGNTDAVLGEVREFLTGERAAPDFDRILTTILFCDIVDSTKRATELGDREWKQLLSRFYALADEKLHHFRGRKLDTAGDGLFAAFDGPARAVRRKTEATMAFIVGQNASANGHPHDVGELRAPPVPVDGGGPGLRTTRRDLLTAAERRFRRWDAPELLSEPEDKKLVYRQPVPSRQRKAAASSFYTPVGPT
jgi:hypothetical protein